MLSKRQQFEDNKSENMELKRSKHQWLNAYDNELGHSLDKQEDENAGKSYISFALVSCSCFQ